MKKTIAVMLCLLLLFINGGCNIANSKNAEPAQPNGEVQEDTSKPETVPEKDDFNGEVSLALSNSSVISTDTPVVMGNTVYFNQKHMGGENDGVYAYDPENKQKCIAKASTLLGGNENGFFALRENQLSFYEGERVVATVSLNGTPELIYCGAWNDIAYFQDVAAQETKLITWDYREKEEPKVVALPREFAADWAFIGNTAYLWRESVAPDLELFALDLDTLECKYLENLSKGGKAVLHASDDVLYIGTDQGLYSYADGKLTTLNITEGARYSFYQNSVYITDLETKVTQSLELKTLQPTDEIGEGQTLYACTKRGILLREGDRLIWPQGSKEAEFKGLLSPSGYAVSDSFVAVTSSSSNTIGIQLYPWK